MIKDFINKTAISCMTYFSKLKENNKGISSIEMVLLILVILGIILLFKDYIEDLIKTVFKKIDKKISSF